MTLARLSWPQNPSAQGSAGLPRQPKRITYPEQRVFERMSVFGHHSQLNSSSLSNGLMFAIVKRKNKP